MFLKNVINLSLASLPYTFLAAVKGIVTKCFGTNRLFVGSGQEDEI